MARIIRRDGSAMLARWTANFLLPAAVLLCGNAAPSRAETVPAVVDENSVGVIIPLVGHSGTPPFSFVAVTRPKHGAAYIFAGNAAYTPDRGFTGADSFLYVVVDAEGHFGRSNTVSITVQPTSPTPVEPPYVTIANNQLVDRRGRPFFVKGLIVRPVIAPFYMDTDPFEYFGDAELAAARAWGANTIRLLTSQAALDPQNSLHNDQYVKSVANAAQQVLEHGFVLILGINDEIGTGETIHHCLPTAATQRAWDTLLKLPFTHPRYRHHVMLELFNEPVAAADQLHKPGSFWWHVWQNGGGVDPFDVGEAEPCVGGKKVGHNQLIAQLRNAGIGNVLIADGLSWAHYLDPRFPLTDPLNQLAYAAHPFLEKWPYFNLVGDPALDYPMLDAAFGDMRIRGPVIATAVDGGGGSTGSDQTTRCWPTAPQVMPVVFDYLRANNMGAVGWVFDMPPHALTLDWTWAPTSYTGFSCPHGPIEGQGGAGQLLQQLFAQ